MSKMLVINVLENCMDACTLALHQVHAIAMRPKTIYKNQFPLSNKADGFFFKTAKPLLLMDLGLKGTETHTHTS